MDLYATSFEPRFLEETSEFYAQEGVRFMQQSDVADYIKHCEVRGPVSGQSGSKAEQ